MRGSITCIHSTCCQEFVCFLEGRPLERMSFRTGTTVYVCHKGITVKEDLRVATCTISNELLLIWVIFTNFLKLVKLNIKNVYHSKFYGDLHVKD